MRLELTENSQADIDEKVDTAARLEENTEGREDDGKDELANVAEWKESVWGWERRCRHQQAGRRGPRSVASLPSGERHDVGLMKWMTCLFEDECIESEFARMKRRCRC